MKNFFKKEKIFKKERSSPNVNLYWRLALGFMFLATFTSLFFGYYLFRKIEKEPMVSTDIASGQVETVKKEAIDKVLEYFSIREKKSIGILNSPSPVVDPSL